MNSEKRDWRKWLNWWRTAPSILRFLFLRVRLARAYYAAERYNILFWPVWSAYSAACHQCCSATCSASCLLPSQGKEEGWWPFFPASLPGRRLLTPAIGGIASGLIIHIGGKLASSRTSTTDYMEAVVLGDGSLSFRSSLTKILSSMFSIASGASIGREGPMVQLSSLVGQARRWSISQRRLILACGAAAGIASAYNAPIAGALFVAEIVLGSIAM